ncbi:EAL domain-containing protein [Acidihalobacter ferrooxydans]|uniref:Two-component system response regulator n=1 Tax=Acidihalobacter ferrooxydans TaxID=1765967 RepID=A0A1P8UF02_9GAMM|nr:EAL domain-containing protein [Acidihalobacter ferrooxydans]APZ42389.1 two-component system response regulator [Acidihalobacter ferrooxydans]
MVDKLLRPLMLVPNLNQAEELISSIKSAGFAVRPTMAQSDQELDEQLKQSSPDVIIAALEQLDFDLGTLMAHIEQAGRHVPVLVLLDHPPEDLCGYLDAGADDVIKRDNHCHFKHAIARTANTQFTWRQLKHAQATLREAEKRCQTLLASSKDAIAYVTDGMHIFANPSYLDMFGFSDSEEIEGVPIMDLVTHDDQGKLKTFLRHYGHENQAGESLQVHLVTLSGERFDGELAFSPASIDGEACTQIVIRQQGDSKELEKQINYLSQRDLMTGLYNRKFFMDQLSEANAKAAKGAGNRSLLSIVLDRFGELKEAFGISGSDLILAEFGKLLDENLPEGDIACRFEGNRFMVLSHTWEPKSLHKLMDHLLDTASNHIYELDNRSISTTVTIGAAIIDENAPGPNELLERAERAFTQAAEAGGARAQIYRPREGEMSQKQIDGIWTDRLRSGIKEGRLRLLFQPIVSLHGDSANQYDVYIHLLDEKDNAVPAKEFMPSAERTDMAKMLDRWIIHNALQKLAETAMDDRGSPTLFIKLSASLLQDPDTLPWLVGKMKEVHILGDRLVFEIKTGIAVNHLRQTREFLKGIHQLHSRLALEDFGIGANPFQLLKQVPADFLKLDAAYMVDLPNNTENQESIKTITAQAHAEGRLVIAQHVEDPNSMSILWGMGVNYVQGNFLQPPTERMDYDFSALS